MIVALSLLSIFVVYYMGPTSSYNKQGGLDFDGSSYISREALPNAGVFHTPNNIYRAKHWVVDARSGTTCYYNTKTIHSVYSSKIDYKPITGGSYPRVSPRGNSYCY